MKFVSSILNRRYSVNNKLLIRRFYLSILSRRYSVNTKIDQQCKTFYSESELDFSFSINSVSDFVSASESGSESGSSSVFMNLDICILFILYLHSSKYTCG